MTERDLENIITAYDEGSFRRAAEKLFLSQPALSQSIRKLETQMGGKLFYCRGNRVEPTELCKNLVELGRPIHHQWLDFQKKADSLFSKSMESVTIVSNEAILTSILFPAIQRFKLTHSDIRFQILERKTEEAESELATGKADLGLFALKFGGKRIASVPILPTEYFLAVPDSHPYARTHPFTNLKEADFAVLKDFEYSEFVIPRTSSRSYAEQMNIFSEAGFTPKSGMITATINTLIQYVQSGLYCSLIKSCYASNYSDLPGVSYYRLNLPAARGFIYAYRSADVPFPPLIEELLEEVRS